jgi:hypothetical protein
LLSVDNLAELTRITLPSGQALEFILAVPPKFDSSEPFFVILARSLRCKSTA